jgi:ATP-binding cassette subfamily B protein
MAKSMRATMILRARLKYPGRMISSKISRRVMKLKLLSVGQKQLISLARAILADPEIFIMDEATSSVDTLTEALIQQGMEAITEERTSFIIAHRLSTIKRADRILVIDNGKIIEEGSHAALLKLKGHYYRLYTEQFRRKLETEYDPYAVSA